MDNISCFLYHSVNFSRFHNLRQNGFNTKEVLGQAARVFWKKGCKSVSLQTLRDQMGIGDGSFYASRGSERE